MRLYYNSVVKEFWLEVPLRFIQKGEISKININFSSSGNTRHNERYASCFDNFVLFTKLHGLYELIFYITKYPMVGFILS